MNNSSRTTNSMRNMGAGVLLSLLGYVVTFVSRTVFVKLLGNDYLSIEGLLTNVVTVLSFTELGLGSASVYCLYKPIAEKNSSKINGLLKYFKKLYKYITLATFVLGFLLIPLLPYLVQMDELSFSNSYFTFVYILFVINTASSYVLIHKKLLLIADQRNYVANIIQQSIHISQIVLQIVFLLMTKNYIIFLLIQICCTLLSNIVTALYVNQKYHDLFSADIQEIGSDDKKDITTNIKSIFIYKLGSVFLNGTDNLIISGFLKTLLVGICSNYVLVISSINRILMESFNGVAASIGNHVSTADVNQQHRIFSQLDTLCSFLYTIVTICLACLLNPFINIWLGDYYILGVPTVLALVSTFYVTGVNQIPSLYRTSYGLFKNAKYFPIAAAVTNIIFSIILAKVMGLIGVFITTSIVKLLFYTAVDSWLIYSKEFKSSVLIYWKNYIYRFAICILGYILISNILKCFSGNGISGLIVIFVVCFLTSSLFVLLAYLPLNSFRLVFNRIRTSVIKR